MPLGQPSQPALAAGTANDRRKISHAAGKAAYLSLEIQFTKYLQESICVYVYLSNIKYNLL